MKKVITVAMTSRSIENKEYAVIEHPEIDKLLNDGYKVEQVASSSSHLFGTITFVLSKD